MFCARSVVCTIPSIWHAPGFRVSKRMTAKEKDTRANALATVHRRPDAWLTEKRPVNLVVVGPQLPPTENAIVEDLASVGVLKGRGDSASDFASLTDADWDGIEVLLVSSPSGKGLDDVVRRAKNLKWIHTATAGVNQVTVPSVLESDIVVTNAKGVFSHSLAEYTLFACNYFAKDLPRLLRSKDERKWDRYPVEELRGRSMGIIGLGNIGLAVATMAKAFKMNIVGVRRKNKLEETEKQIIDAVYSPSDLVKVMGMCDYIVAVLPLTDDTVGIVNAEAIDALQSHAVFINIGRGSTVDEPALIKALQEKRIKGAALDVFCEEPLPPESPLYGLDNVLMSFHNADVTDHYMSDSLLSFRELLEDYISGKELCNIVDVQAGY